MKRDETVDVAKGICMLSMIWKEQFFVIYRKKLFDCIMLSYVYYNGIKGNLQKYRCYIYYSCMFCYNLVKYDVNNTRY